MPTTCTSSSATCELPEMGDRSVTHRNSALARQIWSWSSNQGSHSVMRLREIQWILKAAVPGLEVHASDAWGSKDGQFYQTVTATRDLRERLWLLAKIDQFEQEAESVTEARIFLVGEDKVVVLKDEVTSLTSSVASLKKRASLLLAAIDQVLPPERPNSFSIHVPLEDSLSFKAMQAEIQEIYDIFEQPVRRFSGSDITVGGVDSGSWVIEIITTAFEADVTQALAALKAASMIYDKAIHFMRFLQEREQNALEIESLKLDAKIKKMHAEVEEAKCAAFLKGLAEETCAAFPKVDGENFEVVVARSIKRLAEKLEAGVEMKLASNVPREIAQSANPGLLAPTGALNPAKVVEAPKQITDGTKS